MYIYFVHIPGLIIHKNPIYLEPVTHDTRLHVHWSNVCTNFARQASIISAYFTYLETIKALIGSFYKTNLKRIWYWTIEYLM